MNCESTDQPLLAGEEREYKRKVDLKLWIGIALGALACVLSITGIVLVCRNGTQAAVDTATKGVKALTKTIKSALNGCEIHEGLTCRGSSGDMDSKFADHLWNTPPRGTQGWKKGYQDMNRLVGYTQLKYNFNHDQCTVNVITKTSGGLSLTYYFDGVAQSSASKTFDKSYNKVLSVKVVAATGESLELPAVDFMWNNQAVLQRSGDFRNGQKGAIIEMFGWPDEDVAEECKHIGEAGYLGVKLFPHQEQLMSYQPFNAGSGSELNPWSFMYQPVSYRLDGRMGSRDVLRNTIKKCRSYGVRVYADAVVNHMTGAGNDMSNHRNPSAGCSTWPGKNSSAGENQSPFYTHSWTYEYNQYTGKPNNVLEYPGVPYGPMDFHCEKGINSWTDPNILNTGWLVGLADLDTSKDYVRQRIADFFVDLISIGFSGFRVDAAKHIHPNDLAAIFGKFKDGMGGNIPEDWITWLEVLTGGEASLLVRNSEYSYTTGLTNALAGAGLNNDDINKVKVWWCGYPNEPNNDEGTLTRWRKVIQNDDHDQQNPGSSSRDMHDRGCVLVKGCDPNKHREYEVRLFQNPYEIGDNDNEYPIRLVLSSYYFTDGVTSIPDGQSDCSKCQITCDGCKSRPYAKAYQANAKAYEGRDYTRVHRDQAIINAMRKWMHM